MSFSRVFITGMGAISSLGESVPENFEKLKLAQKGIKKAKLIDSRLKEDFLFAEIPLTNEELKLRINEEVPSHFARTTLLGILAVKEAIKGANISNSDLDGIIMGCTVSAMCETENLYKNAQGIDNGSPFCDSYDIGSSAMEISSFLGGLPFQNTINTACSSSANAIAQGMMMIRCGEANKILVGGSDALSKYTINGFNSMMLLSADYCKPFQQNRDGINLGEAAAFFILESEESLGDKIPLAEIVGFGNTNDSFHATSISDNGEGPFKAMNNALKLAGIQARDIDYINAHGTGTENNDMAEAEALKRIFSTVPPFSSTKLYTGHTLGAAGALEAVFSVEMMLHNYIVGDDNFLQKDNSIQLVPTKSEQNKSLKYVMSNSFGFGGNCTSLIFKNVKS